MTSTRERSALRAMYVGTALSVAAALVPYFERGTLSEHIRSGYPDYTHERIDSAVTAYLVILSVVGALGVASWVGTMWAVRRHKSWARWAAALMFAVGTSVALAGLLVKDTSGKVGLAPAIGWLSIVPCVAGALAVGLLWRPSAHTVASAT